MKRKLKLTQWRPWLVVIDIIDHRCDWRDGSYDDWSNGRYWSDDGWSDGSCSLGEEEDGGGGRGGGERSCDGEDDGEDDGWDEGDEA